MTRSSDMPLAETALVFVAVLWAGMLAGVSFLATPVKFQAASLSLPVALEVGRVTFWTFSRVEWGLALLLGAAALFPPASRFVVACVLLIASMVAVQALWLLPLLDARVEAVIAGASLPPSPHHLLYALAEAAKLLLLCAVAFSALRGLWFAHRRSAVGSI